MVTINKTNIAHPLKNRVGTSQRSRINDALNSSFAPIDGKTLADRLYVIGAYSKLINHHSIEQDSMGNEFFRIEDWSQFFSDSVVFQLTDFSKINVDSLNEKFNFIYDTLQKNPTSETLEALLNFIYNNLLEPIDSLYLKVKETENSYSNTLTGIVKSSFINSVKSYIGIFNSSVTFFCINKKKFNLFLKDPWSFKPTEIYELDKSIKNVKKGKSAAIKMAAEKLKTIYQQIIVGFEEIVKTSPNYIKESLYPLKESLLEQHAPHLALLFTFLELFKYLQNNINNLGQKHLDFFYKEVLKLSPKNEVADQVHLILEIANHLDGGYLLKKGLLFKDGKDLNKQDIHFSLENDLVIDKAQITDLMTLSLFPSPYSPEKKHLEGLFITTVANSMDGKGKKFKDKNSSWPTLGRKYIKLKLENNQQFQEHQEANLGFVLSSPVLLLNEGKRKITISLNCEMPIVDSSLGLEDYNAIFEKLNPEPQSKEYLLDEDFIKCLENLFKEKKISEKAKTHFLYKIELTENNSYTEEDLDDILSKTDPENDLPLFKTDEITEIKKCFLKTRIDIALFNIQLSGEKEWVVPSINSITLTDTSDSAEIKKIDIVLDLELTDDQPSIIFYNKEILKQEIELKTPYPVVKIELNSEFKLKCTTEELSPVHCCLKKKNLTNETFYVSAYEILRGLEIQDANITAEVCGVKDLIVQNEISLQDVNSTIMPFGPRPKIDSAFYIGSKEVFCKNWDSVGLIVEWKDRPEDFSEYYEAYNQNPPPDIDNSIFKINAGLLTEGTWIEEGVDRDLFESNETLANCDRDVSDFRKDGYVWNKGNFAGFDYKNKSMPLAPFQPLDVKTRKGFLRLVLKNEDFQHDRYAFVLAEQMMKISNTANLIKLSSFLEKLNESCEDADELETLTDQIRSAVAGNEGDPITEELVDMVVGTIATDGLETAMDNLEAKICELSADVNNITNGEPPVLPNEPYTPQIKSISIDYTANATIKDIDIVHLYPFENTSKFENIEESPFLFPYFNDEGTLFVGIKELTPGSQLSLLFQLAEATADSEQERANIEWHYLKNNEWYSMQPGFDIINDATDGLTVSGIVTIAIPDDIATSGHTIMPDDQYWIKVSAAENVNAVAETIGIHTQAALATAELKPKNDKERLDNPLEAGKVTKLVESDFNVKKIAQLYESFGGKKPEASGHYYTRVSEHLKHKGRGIMIEDCEKIILEEFREIYKVKCISHTIGLPANEFRRDLEIAPGFVVLAVIPDLTKLKSEENINPKVPISLLEKIAEYIKNRISPFARIKVMNPRYEAVNVTIEVQFHKGKNTAFYSSKLKEEISEFLAPWHLGDSEKLSFGQEVQFSDVVGFVENKDYVDFIHNLDLTGECNQSGALIKPTTARSILTAGNIVVETRELECPPREDDDQKREVCPDYPRCEKETEENEEPVIL